MVSLSKSLMCKKSFRPLPAFPLTYAEVDETAEELAWQEIRRQMEELTGEMVEIRRDLVEKEIEDADERDVASFDKPRAGT